MKAPKLHLEPLTQLMRRRAACFRLTVVLAAALLALSAVTSRAAEVKQLWDKNCASCHGKDGKGHTKAGKKAGVVDLTKPENQARSTDEKMFTSVKHGVLDDKNKVKMKPAEKLSDTEIKKLIAYVRTLKQ